MSFLESKNMLSSASSLRKFGRSYNLGGDEIVLSKNSLTDNEYKLLQHQLSKKNSTELITSWQQLLQVADAGLLRKFLNKLDVDQTNQIPTHLFDAVNIAVVVKIFANINYANLWVNSDIKRDSLGSDLAEFNKFMLDTQHEKYLESSLLLNLSGMPSHEIKFFILLFNKMSNKYLQLKHGYLNFPQIVHESILNNPNTDNLENKFQLGNYTFMNYSMFSTINTLPHCVLSTVDELTEYIVSTITDIESLKTLCLIYMARLPNNVAEKLDFAVDFLITKYTTNHIPEHLVIILLKISCIAVYSLSISQLNNFLASAVQLYQKMGDYTFSLMTKEDISDSGINLLQRIFNLTQYFLTLKVHVSLDACSLAAFVLSLENQKVLYLKNNTQYRSLDETLLDFAGQELNVIFPLTADEINILKQQFNLVQKFEQQFALFSQNQLITIITDIKHNLSSTDIDIISSTNNICQLIAIANFAFVQYFNIYLHNVQVLTVLGMLLPNVNFKGRLAQVKTGEGKSNIVTLLALILACQNKFVDIITSSAYLSIRDEHKYKQFFEYFGITTAHICSSQNNFTAQIIYGTNYDFEFAKLFDDLYLHGNRVIKKDSDITRPFQVVIVDEVDNMLVDKALNSARIAYPSQNNWLDAYPIIYNFVANTTTKSVKPDTNTYHACNELLTQHNIPEIKLKQLIENAYKACYEYHLNLHYCIKKTKGDNLLHDGIVIIDLDTGRLNEGSRWQHGLHQFLELKHNLPVQQDTLTLGALSHPAFFKEYAEIYGVSGTIGGEIERAEIASIYNLSTFDVPTHKPTLRKQLDTIVCETTQEFNNILVAEINEVLNNSRPVLILCQSIISTEGIVKLLKNRLNAQLVQVLNDVQINDEDFIVKQAGSSRVVTVATNAAGRGTDIPISKIAMQRGGLHVIFTFFPSNKRIEDQGAGRAGRQGNNGSYRIIVPHDDEYCLKIRKEDDANSSIQQLFDMLLDVNRYIPNKTHKITKERLLTYRTIQVQQESKNRILQSQFNLAQHLILEKFYNWYHSQLKLPKFNKDTVLMKWANFYTELEDIEITEQGENLFKTGSQQLDSYTFQIAQAFKVFCQSLTNV